jgi:hypothetical protein
MRPNKLMLAGLVVTLIGLFVVIKHEMGLPPYWTPLPVGIGLLIGGAFWSLTSPVARWGPWRSQRGAHEAEQAHARPAERPIDRGLQHHQAGVTHSRGRGL